MEGKTGALEMNLNLKLKENLEVHQAYVVEKHFQREFRNTAVLPKYDQAEVEAW